MEGNSLDRPIYLFPAAVRNTAVFRHYDPCLDALANRNTIHCLLSCSLSFHVRPLVRHLEILVHQQGLYQVQQ